MSEYVYQEYPKVKYHPKHEPRTVQNIKEEKALGRGWGTALLSFPNHHVSPVRCAMT